MECRWSEYGLLSFLPLKSWKMWHKWAHPQGSMAGSWLKWQPEMEELSHGTEKPWECLCSSAQWCKKVACDIESIMQSPGHMEVAVWVMHGLLLMSIKALQISLQLMLFEGGYKSFPFSYCESVFQDPDTVRSGIRSPRDCAKYIIDEAVSSAVVWWCYERRA